MPNPKANTENIDAQKDQNFFLKIILGMFLVLRNMFIYFLPKNRTIEAKIHGANPPPSPVDLPMTDAQSAPQILSPVAIEPVNAAIIDSIILSQEKKKKSKNRKVHTKQKIDKDSKNSGDNTAKLETPIIIPRAKKTKVSFNLNGGFDIEEPGNVITKVHAKASTSNKDKNHEIKINFFKKKLPGEMLLYMTGFIRNEDLGNFSTSSRRFFKLSFQMIINQLNTAFEYILNSDESQDKDYKDLILSFYGLKYLSKSTFLNFIDKNDKIENKQLKLAINDLKYFIDCKKSDKSFEKKTTYKSYQLELILRYFSNQYISNPKLQEAFKIKSPLNIFFCIHKEDNDVESAYEKITTHIDNDDDYDYDYDYDNDDYDIDEDKNAPTTNAPITVDENWNITLTGSIFDTLLFNQKEFRIHLKNEHIVSVFIIPNEQINKQNDYAGIQSFVTSTVNKGHDKKAYVYGKNCTLKNEWLLMTYKMQSNEYLFNLYTNPLHMTLIKTHCLESNINKCFAKVIPGFNAPEVTKAEDDESLPKLEF